MKSNRTERLMPGGIPRWIRCYDNGGETADRYTVCFTGKASVERSGSRTEYPYRAMSSDPCHPQGVGLWGANPWRHCDVNKSGFAPAIGRKCHLGERIPFQLLPDACKRLVVQDYREIWKL